MDHVKLMWVASVAHTTCPIIALIIQLITFTISMSSMRQFVNNKLHGVFSLTTRPIIVLMITVLQTSYVAFPPLHTGTIT